MIHTYGDSHSMFAWELINPKVKINWLGPRLMYSFGDKNEIVVNPLDLKKNDVVVFSFGEIDCRCHIHKFVNNNKDNIKEVIENLVCKYVETIKKNAELYLDLNIKTCVYSIPPPIKKVDGSENPDYPFVGDDYDRLIYHKTMNECLRQKCFEENIVLIDVYDDYSDKEGFLIREYSDKNCHIENPIFLEKKIKEYGLVNE